jgi:bifunctional DNA-binding transcriptional regulator/antitoxin component of YhaV-PrlF toxin-antitoxin module
MLSTRFSQAGRVVTPALLKEQLNLKQGDELVMEIKDGALILTSKQQGVAQIRDEIRAGMTLEPGRSLADELIADRRAESDMD